MITWNDPVSAISTMRQDGHLKIEGQNSTFYLGVSPQSVGFPVYQGIGGRLVTPNVQSFEMTVDYPSASIPSPASAGASSVEQSIRLLSRNRSPATVAAATLLSRYRSVKEMSCAVFRSERKGTVLNLQ